MKENLFFCREDSCTKLFLIEEDYCNKLKDYKFSMDLDKSSAIDLNEDFLALNSYNKIYLFNKKNNYSFAKTINLDIDYKSSTIIYRINNHIVSMFIEGESIQLINYDISLNGIKWIPRKTKTVINKRIYYVKQINKNHILFMGKKKCYFGEIQLNQKKID